MGDAKEFEPLCDGIAVVVQGTPWKHQHLYKTVGFVLRTYE